MTVLPLGVTYHCLVRRNKSSQWTCKRIETFFCCSWPLMCISHSPFLTSEYTIESSHSSHWCRQHQVSRQHHPVPSARGEQLLCREPTSAAVRDSSLTFLEWSGESAIPNDNHRIAATAKRLPCLNKTLPLGVPHHVWRDRGSRLDLQFFMKDKASKNDRIFHDLKTR